MKIIPTLLAVGVLLAFVTTGCQSPKVRSASRTRVAQSTRNNCYSLLYQLLNDQKNVSMLRFIKRENSDVKKLVKNIAVNSAAGAKLLEEFAKEDPSIRLDGNTIGFRIAEEIAEEIHVSGGYGAESLSRRRILIDPKELCVQSAIGQEPGHGKAAID